MPIEIQYTEDKIGVVFCAVGRVTGEEIIAAQKTIHDSEGFVDLRYWIVDRSRCTEYTVSTDEVSQIADMDNNAAKRNPHLLMALVSESDLQFGVSRMYEAQIDANGFKTMSFRDRASAEKWIENELGQSLP